MRSLEIAARWELIVLIVAFGAVTLWQLVRAGNFAGLLLASDNKTISPGRIQLLMVTVLTALQYLLATLHDPSHFPALPPALVAAMGGSQLVYLGTKAWDMKNRNGDEK